MSPPPDDSAPPGIDPYIDWVLGPGRPHYFRPGRQQERFAVLVHLTKTRAGDFARGHGFTDIGMQRDRWRAAIFVPRLYAEDRTDDGARDITCPALVTDEFFTMLRDSSRAATVVRRVTLSLPPPVLPPELRGGTT